MKLLSWLWGFSAVMLSGCASIQVDKDAAARKELAPTGTLRLAAVPAPVPSTVLVGKDPATGQFAGVPVDIASALARKLGVPLEIVTYKSGSLLQETADTGAWDVAFIPLDREREKYVAFGPVYLVVESTYLVPPDSKLRTIADVDRTGVRVVARASSPQMRHLSRSLRNATLLGVDTAEEQLELLRAGKADAITSGNTYLLILASKWPGARVLEGSFASQRVAIAVPKGQPIALKYVTEFLEEAKASGVVRRAFDKLGLKDLPIPPPSSLR